MLIITGCARSGTMRISQAMEAAGISCPHEPEINKQAYPHKAKVSWIAPLTVTDSDTVWHITRHPILVAESLRRAEVFRRDVQNEYTNIAIATIGDSFLDSSIPELDYWIDWNQNIESLNPSLRIDTGSFGIKEIVRAAKITGNAIEISDTLRDTLACKTINTGGRIECWISLGGYKRLDELKYVMERYGYEQ